MQGLSYAERDTLKTILRAHGLGGDDDDLLLSRLETFAAWIREIDQTRIDKHGYQAQLPLVLLSLMGIHGDKART